MEQVRVRFAPSPTGYLHIGGARTALFNWFFARQNKGKFVLRIEDTDTERLKEDSVTQILESMKWLGITWDEGPYYQSERQEFYQAAAEKLLNSGQAYYCFCTEEELQQERELQREKGQAICYSGKCRSLSEEEIKQRLERQEKPVIRLKVPADRQIVVNDLIRGTVTFNAELYDDFIIVKSNGTPAYNFACVVDDYAMKISHVIRAEEHLSNTPKQQLIYEALGYEFPKFAHISMILAPDRSKLSKRHGATSVSEYKEMGCLPEALVNYLTLLGWSPPQEQGEVFTPEETLKSFDLSKVSKTAAIYDTQKLFWLNGQYISQYDLNELAEQTIPFICEAGLITAGEAEKQREYIIEAIKLVRDRVKSLPEMVEALAYFFNEVSSYDEKGEAKFFCKEGAVDLLQNGRDCLAGIVDFTEENVERAYRALSEKLQIKAGQLIHPTRLALTGRTVSPGIFEVMVVLGKERCLQRLDQAINYIQEKGVADN